MWYCSYLTRLNHEQPNKKGSSSSIWKKPFFLIPNKKPFICHPLQWYHCLFCFLGRLLDNPDHEDSAKNWTLSTSRTSSRSSRRTCCTRSNYFVTKTRLDGRFGVINKKIIRHQTRHLVVIPQSCEFKMMHS